MQLFISSLIIVSAYYLGLFLGGRNALNNFLNKTYGMSIKHNINDGSVETITYYYSEEAYKEKIQELKYGDIMENEIIQDVEMEEMLKPSIDGIYFNKPQIVQGSDFNNHIRGDFYYEDVCVGYYDPLYHNDNQLEPTTFIRIEEGWEYLRDKFSSYTSIFSTDLTQNEAQYGIEELLKDLEFMTYLYSFMHKIVEDDKFEEIGLVGIINNELMQVVQIKDKTVKDYAQILNFIKNNIKSFILNDNYPIKFFTTLNDFKVVSPFNITLK